MDIAMVNRCIELPIAYDAIYIDSMLGWLVRWLRMLGLNVNYSPDFDDKYLMGVNGLVITRDKGLFELRKGDSLLLLTLNHEHWLIAASKTLGLKLSINPEESLCPVCGSRLVRVGKDAVKDKVPSRVLDAHEEFWVCTGCGRVYWMGSHHVRINKILSRARALSGRLMVKCVNNLLIIQLQTK